ncbi:uncharacterized protein [Coffea arabica]|uniref:Retrotransposon gag domain-containing protein n=1 Tax=Coffea arabica TaxID=13443 RepID=A0ABM4W2Q3_COFAR
MANTQTLRELAAPELTHQPLCITFPTLAENTAFELKSGLIHLLPSFHGLSGEEPHKHVKEFEMVCSSMKPLGVTEEQIRLRAFPFSLKDAAKDWLYYLPAGSITTWVQLKKKFLEKFFLASRAASLRKEICSIKQYPGEFLSIIDATSGGALANKTPKEAWELIEAMVENSQQFCFRESNPTRRVNEVESTSIQQQLSELTSVVRQLAVGKCPKLEKTKRAEKKKEILDVFRKVQVNIPLLDVIKQVPKYAKFLKDLCVNKRKLRGDERVMVGENVSAVLQRKFPPKCGDPGPLKETGIIIQLADRTCAYPDGIVEDVLVQVDGLIFPADFYVLYMDDRSAPNPSPIILERPFLSTARTKIDVSKEFSKFAYRGKFKVAANKSYRMKAIHEEVGS